MTGFIDTFREEFTKLAEEKERSYGKAVGQAYLRLLGALVGGAMGTVPGILMFSHGYERPAKTVFRIGRWAGAFGGGLGVRALQKEEGERLRPDLIAAETVAHRIGTPFSPLVSALMFRKVYKDKSKK